MTRARSNILLTTYYVFGSVLRILCRHYDSCLCIDEKTEVQGDEQKAHIRQSHSRSSSLSHVSFSRFLLGVGTIILICPCKDWSSEELTYDTHLVWVRAAIQTELPRLRKAIIFILCHVASLTCPSVTEACTDSRTSVWKALCDTWSHI